VATLVFQVYNHLSMVYHTRPCEQQGESVIHNDRVLFPVLGDYCDQTRLLLWHSLESVFFAVMQRRFARCGCSFVALIFLSLNECQ
jgi:hypothetical protein